MMNKCLSVCCFLWMSLSVAAQDIISSFIDKHGKDDNLEVVSIGKKMMKTMDSLTIDNPDLKNAIKDLESIRIVSSKDSDLDKEYFNSARDLLSKSKGLKEFFSINEQDKELIVMIRETKNSIRELILLSEQPDEFNLISISGTIDLDILLKYSEGLHIKELNQLKTIKRNQ